MNDFRSVYWPGVILLTIDNIGVAEKKEAGRIARCYAECRKFKLKTEIPPPEWCSFNAYVKLGSEGGWLVYSAGATVLDAYVYALRDIFAIERCKTLAELYVRMDLACSGDTLVHRHLAEADV